MRKRFVAVIVPIALALTLASCQSPVTMWGSCSAAAGGDTTGTDGTYVLNCEGGTWVPLMTVDEFARLARGEKVSIAPLPKRPTTTTTTQPTTTTTTASTSTTSTSSTTSTTALVTATLVFSNAQDSTLSNFGFLTGSGLLPGAAITTCSDQYSCQNSGITVDGNGSPANVGVIFAATGCRTNISFSTTKADGQPITSNVASYPVGTPGCP